MLLNNSPPKTNTLHEMSCHELSRLDSPEILKNIHQATLSKEGRLLWLKKCWSFKRSKSPLEEEKKELSNMIDGIELGQISEDSDSVSD